MNKRELREYKRLRAIGWHAEHALSHARTLVEFDKARNEFPGEDDIGAVRLRVESDDHMSFDDLTGDTYNASANPDIQKSRMDREREAERERIERDGVFGIIGEYWNGAEWVDVDAVWGFVGEDWKDSGYDSDIMRATLDAARTFVDSQLLVGAV
jgi:hypothetical protein